MRLFISLIAAILIGCSTAKVEEKKEEIAEVPAVVKEEPTILVAVEPVAAEDTKETAVAEVEETPVAKPLIKDIYDAVGLTMFAATALAAVALIAFKKKEPAIAADAASEAPKSDEGNQ